MSKKRDLTGVRNGKLVGVNCTNVRCSNGDYIWNFVCDCGNHREMSVGQFSSKSNLACKLCTKERVKEKSNYHGLKDTKVYTSWRKIKERCFNKNCIDYQRYGAKGVTMQEEYVNDVLAFLEEVGHAPEDTRAWTIDRIDHTKGYVKGNMRWATVKQQSRNKGMYDSNKTGVTGVSWDNKGQGNWYAKVQWKEWIDDKPKHCHKSFSVKKLGLLEAFAYACQYREDKIKELNALGYGYSDNHGE